ncbi:MAG: AMP-binding protein, partial [Porphyrobacter sp.]|nr:AMP-binding protein [Porphyrobacter sp.]
AREAPTREIVSRWADGSETRTNWAGIRRDALKMAQALQRLGLKPGDKVASLAMNHARHLVSWYGVAGMGGVLHTVNPRLFDDQLEYIVNHAEDRVLCYDAAFQPIVDRMKSRWPTVEHYICYDSGAHAPAFEDWIGAEDGDFEWVTGPETDPCMICYTSGTTGNPKGAQLTNTNLLGLRNAGMEAGLDWQFYEPDDCMLVAMPCAHIGGTGLVNIAVANGVRSLVQAEFSPVGVLEAIEAGATHMFIVPAALQMVVQHPRAVDTDFSNLKYLMYGAAPMPLELLKEAVRTMPTTKFLQAYGMTETSGTISILPPEDHSLEGNQRMRSAGKACPAVEIEVRGPDNREVPRGEIGEVCILSPTNTPGYWKLPEATAKTIDPDGWLHTGDAGVMDDDGYVYIQDRIKDMIISGGENVYPA